MKKIVVKLDVHSDKDKQKAMKAVSTLLGIDSIAVDVNAQKMTIIGSVDPVDVVSKLRKFWNTQIDSVGLAKEPEKKEEKKEEGKKEEGKKEEEAKKEEDPNKKEEAGTKEGKKEEAAGEKKKDEQKPGEAAPPQLLLQHQQMLMNDLVHAYKAYNPYVPTQYFVRSIEENPNSCVIC